LDGWANSHPTGIRTIEPAKSPSPNNKSRFPRAETTLLTPLAKFPLLVELLLRLFVIVVLFVTLLLLPLVVILVVVIVIVVLPGLLPFVLLGAKMNVGLVAASLEPGRPR
jgi:hypothetical protein